MANQDLDRQLDQLAEQVQQATSALERQLALKAFFELLYEPGVLRCPQKNRHSPEEYQDLYQEALHDVIVDFHRYLQKFDRRKGSVRKWVNKVLEHRLTDVINKRNDKRRNGSRTVYILDSPDSSNLEPATPDHELSDAELLRDFILEDPKGILRENPFTGPPEVTFQMLLIRRHLDGQRWRDVSAEFGIPTSSLSEFYRRRLKKLMPILQECLNY